MSSSFFWRRLYDTTAIILFVIVFFVLIKFVQFRPYLQASKREALADYSLPVAVITLSFVGSYLFQDVTVERFRYDDKNVFSVAPLERLSWLAVLGAMGLGFSLSLLFFMDQNITSAMVNNPCNKYTIHNNGIQAVAYSVHHFPKRF